MAPSSHRLVVYPCIYTIILVSPCFRPYPLPFHSAIQPSSHPAIRPYPTAMKSNRTFVMITGKYFRIIVKILFICCQMPQRMENSPSRNGSGLSQKSGYLSRVAGDAKGNPFLPYVAVGANAHRSLSLVPPPESTTPYIPFVCCRD